MYDVISIGSATIDAFAKTAKSDLISITTQKETDNEAFLAYPIGTKILINELEFTTGGGGTNTAVCFSRLGLKTAYCGKIGKLGNGQIIINRLKKEKIDFIGAYSTELSGYSIILDSISHDRTILTYKGANNYFRFAELNKKKLKAKWFYCCAMIDKSFKELEKTMDYAKKNNIKIMFNPSSYLAEKGIKYLSKVLKNTNILVFNKEEARSLVGKHDVSTLLKLLKNLIGNDIIIITDGENGVYVTDGEYEYTAKPHKIKVIETTGAGDAFGSSFLAGIIKKNDIEFAIKLAVTNSESVILHHGAKNKLLKWSEALKNMRKSPVIIKKKKFK